MQVEKLTFPFSIAIYSNLAAMARSKCPPAPSAETISSETPPRAPPAPSDPESEPKQLKRGASKIFPDNLGPSWIKAKKTTRAQAEIPAVEATGSKKKKTPVSAANAEIPAVEATGSKKKKTNKADDVDAKIAGDDASGSKKKKTNKADDVDAKIAGDDASGSKKKKTKIAGDDATGSKKKKKTPVSAADAEILDGATVEEIEQDGVIWRVHTTSRGGDATGPKKKKQKAMASAADHAPADNAAGLKKKKQKAMASAADHAPAENASAKQNPTTSPTDSVAMEAEAGAGLLAMSAQQVANTYNISLAEAAKVLGHFVKSKAREPDEPTEPCGDTQLSGWCLAQQ